jgi:hypothetical protein
MVITRRDVELVLASRLRRRAPRAHRLRIARAGVEIDLFVNVARARGSTDNRRG